MIYRIGEMGLLYRKIEKRLNDLDKDRKVCLSEQSLLSEVRQEMRDYYRLVAILQSHLTTSQDAQTLSLKRLFVWISQPLARLRIIWILLEVCRESRGTSIVSVIHNYSIHGDPEVHDYIIKLLSKV